MPRPSKPTSSLAKRTRRSVDGNIEKNYELDGRSPGPAPKHFSQEEIGVWNELCEEAVVDLLGAPDRKLLEAAAELIAEKRELGRRFRKMPQLMHVLDRLGMSPFARATMAPALATHRLGRTGLPQQAKDKSTAAGGDDLSSLRD